MAIFKQDPSEESLTVEIEDFDGNQLVNRVITSYSLTSEYFTPTDAWDFTVYSEDNPAALRREFKGWQPIRLSIAGNQQVLGRIDGSESAGPNGTALQVFGRDYLADIVDPGVDPTFQVKQGMDIGAFLEELLKPHGITTIFGSFNLTRNILTGKQPAFIPDTDQGFKSAKLSDFKAEEDQGMMEYLLEVLHRQGYMLLPAGTRDAAVVDRPQYGQEPRYRISRPGNVVGAPKCRRDFSSVPTVTIARGRGGQPNGKLHDARREYATFGDSGISHIGRITDVRRVIYNRFNEVVIRDKRFNPKGSGETEIFGYNPPVYKPLFYRDKQARNQAELERGLKKVVSERLRKTLEYECEIRGHVDPKTGQCWAIDTIAQVDDEVEDLHERLWIQERTFYNDGTSGPMTRLKMIRPDSYVL